MVVPWMDGYYKLPSMNGMVFHVTGENAKTVNLVGETDPTLELGSWKFGEFDEAREEIAEHTGKKHYDVEIEMWGGFWKTKGVVSDDGKRITIWSAANTLTHFEHITDEEYLALKNAGEPACAPSHHYKIQPEYQGKLVWLSGAPGLGKSTTAHILSKTTGYVYYEGDAFGSHMNPYIPPEAEDPALAMMKQKALIDVPEDRVKAVEDCTPDFVKMMQGEEFSTENVKGYYTVLCQNVKDERARFGGDWVVVGGVMNRTLRDHIKEQLGCQLIFVVLHMGKEDVVKRLTDRHGEGNSLVDMCLKVYDAFEPVHVDEENVIGVEVSADMTRDQVVKKVRECCNI